MSKTPVESHVKNTGRVTCQKHRSSHMSKPRENRAERNPGAPAEGCSDARTCQNREKTERSEIPARQRRDVATREAEGCSDARTCQTIAATALLLPRLNTSASIRVNSCVNSAFIVSSDISLAEAVETFVIYLFPC